MEAVGGKDVKPKTKPPFGTADSNRIKKMGFDPALTKLPSKYALDKELTKLKKEIKATGSESKINHLENQKSTF